jgi:uncharacterized protein (DUF2267 family)
MTHNFDKYASKGNEFLNKLAARLGDNENPHRAMRTLRSVLHALRNRLSTEESLQLMAQLPMVIKAVYVDGWKLNSHHNRIKTMEEFSEEVMREDGLSAWKDFPGVSDATLAIEAVMKTLADYVTAGELHDVIAILPKDMKSRLLVWVHTP